MKKGVVLVVLFSVMLLTSVSFASAGFWDWWTGGGNEDILLSPEGCSTNPEDYELISPFSAESDTHYSYWVASRAIDEDDNTAWAEGSSAYPHQLTMTISEGESLKCINGINIKKLNNNFPPDFFDIEIFDGENWQSIENNLELDNANSNDFNFQDTYVGSKIRLASRPRPGEANTGYSTIREIYVSASNYDSGGSDSGGSDDDNQQQIIYVSEDASTFQGNVNNVNDGSLVYAGGGSGYHLYGWFKFDISDIQEDTTSVELNVYNTIYNDNSHGISLAVYYCDSNSWAENSINWDNQPQGCLSAYSVGTLYIDSPGEWHSLDVTNMVNSAIDSGEDEVTIVIKLSIGEDKDYSASFASKTRSGGTHKAYLDVQIGADDGGSDSGGDDNQDEEPSCVDSDISENDPFSVPGNITGINSQGESYTFFDYCVDSENIEEQICNGVSADNVTESCNYGCLDVNNLGARCVGPSNLKVNVEDRDTGQGIPNAQFELYYENGDRYNGAVGSFGGGASDGQSTSGFAVNNLASGVYTVVISANDYSEESSVVDIGIEEEFVKNIGLQPICDPNVECEIIPAVCPASGIQMEVCTDLAACGGQPYQTQVTCVPDVCSGCQFGEECLPYNYRVETGGDAKYCGITGDLLVQKPEGSSCQNNFECSSNLCSSGECVEIKDAIEQNERVESLLLRIWCRITNLRNNDNFNECLGVEDPGNGGGEDVQREIISIENTGNDRLNVEFTNYNNVEKNFQFAISNTQGTFLHADSDGRKIVVAEGQKILRNEYVVAGNEDEGHLLKLSQVTNQTTGFNNDKVTFTDKFSDVSYEATITSDGTGTLSVGGKVYVVYYGGSSSADSNWVRLDYPDSRPDSRGNNEIIVYPTIQTSLGAKVALYEPVNISYRNWDGIGNGINIIKFPDGDGYTSVSIVEMSGSSSKDVSVGKLTYRIIKSGSNNNLGIYLKDPRFTGSTYPEGREVILAPSIIIFEEKDNQNEYNSLVVTTEEGYTSEDGIGVNWVSMTAPKTESVRDGNRVTKLADRWGSIVTLDFGESDQGTASISYPDTQEDITL